MVNKSSNETLIMIIFIIFFLVALIALAQLNCFIERRREIGRREIQNLKIQRQTVLTTASS